MFKGLFFSKVVATLGLSLGCGFLGSQAVQAASFQGLGDLPGGLNFSSAIGISADGSTIVGISGSSNTTGQEAFRWNQDTGMVGLGDLVGGTFDSTARGTSANGSIVVGQSSSVNGNEAFRWTQTTGMVGLGDFPGGSFFSG
jgi:probable HAF family extracellular repeat protein